MKIGLVGLGKMGFGMAEHLNSSDFDLIATDKVKETVDRAKKAGIDAVYSIEALLDNLDERKIVFLMVPAGKPVDDCIKEILKTAEKGDMIIDCGNSYYKDSIRRAEELKKKGILYLDVGTSGGIKISEGKACMMVGGVKGIFELLEPVFKSLCVENGYNYIGKSGAGHLVKGYHNFVEYVTMEGIAEGAEAIKSVSEKEDMNVKLRDVFDVWNHGSINEGMLVESAKKALEKYNNLEDIDGRVYGETTEEMAKLADLAESLNIEVPAGRVAIKRRKESQTKESYATKLINAMRNVFGGHKPGKKADDN
ncbi:MAG: NADP-dependent phosphogluconate dehydrogenase [Candidatus Undinarchaeales archaeon]